MRDQNPDSPASGDGQDEERVRRLIESAGPRPSIPADDLEAIRSAARVAWKRKARERGADGARTRLRPILVATAAALALAVGLVWWWGVRTSPAPETFARVEATTGQVVLEEASGVRRTLRPGDALRQGATLDTGREAAPRVGRAALRLASGVSLRLDVGSRVRLTALDRVELVRGALYLDTAPQGEAPASIRVITSLGTARDLGTRFAVRLDDSKRGSLRVQVRAGTVVVDRDGRTYTARAGEELALHGDGAVDRHRLSPYGPEWAWVLEAAPGFAIEGRSVEEFLAWVERETGWQVRYADRRLAARVGEITLHGDIGDLRPDQAPFAVLPGAGLQGTLEAGVLTIHRRSVG